jgi:hypothetical protein
MSAPLVTQLCRIIAPERLSDRFLSSGVLTASESRSLGDTMILAYVFEVMQPWLPSAHLLPALTATLEAEYPKLVDPANQGSIDDKFELLLRAVNQTLNTVSEGGETDWIGNLNGIIMVFSGEELHFSQTGQCPAYLLQNNRIRQVTDDLPATQDPHPLKTFSNLASGQLKDGDQILVANRELYREISLDALRRILNTTSPFQATQAISKELKREKNPAVSSLILKFTEAPIATPEPETVVLEEEMQSGIKKFGKRLAPLLHRAKAAGVKAGEMASAGAKQAKATMAEKVAPKVSELAQKAKDSIKNGERSEAAAVEATPNEAVPSEPVKVEEPAKEELPVVEIIVSKKQREKEHQQAIAEAAEARVGQDEEEEFTSVVPSSEFVMETKETPEHTILHTIKATLLAAWNKLLPLIKKLLAAVIVWLKPAQNRKKAALGAGILILVLTLWVGFRAAHKPASNTTNESNSTLLSEARKLKDTIAGEIGAGQTIQASTDVSNAFTKLSSLKDPNSSQQADADGIWTDITTESDQLTKTTRFATSTAHYAFTGDVRGIVTSLPYFYGWNASSSKLLRTGIGIPTETQASVALADANDSLISVTRTTESDVAGYALSKQGKVFRVVQNGSQTLLRNITPASGDFAVGDAITSYSGNVYILDGKAGLLWKYANSGTTYAKGVSIIDINKYDIKKAVSVAVDGSFYILKSDGSLSKYTGGKQDASFLLQNIPTLAQKLVQPASVITSESYPNLYVLDTGATSSSWSTAKVQIFAKDGSYVGQYAFPKEMTKVRAFDINPKDKKLYVLNDQTVYEFGLP